VLSKNCGERLLDSSCPSASLIGRMEQLGFHWTDFDEILHFGILEKGVEKIQVSL
jgi:hypothetical protein